MPPFLSQSSSSRYPSTAVIRTLTDTKQTHTPPVPIIPTHHATSPTHTGYLFATISLSLRSLQWRQPHLHLLPEIVTSHQVRPETYTIHDTLQNPLLKAINHRIQALCLLYHENLDIFNQMPFNLAFALRI